jgi:hypothetical protein
MKMIKSPPSRALFLCPRFCKEYIQAARALRTADMDRADVGGGRGTHHKAVIVLSQCHPSLTNTEAVVKLHTSHNYIKRREFVLWRRYTGFALKKT